MTGPELLDLCERLVGAQGAGEPLRRVLRIVLGVTDTVGRTVTTVA
jgi:hypothetical protein